MKYITLQVWVVLLCICQNTQAQETHLYFDVHSKEIKYQQNGIDVEKAKIKQGDFIVFHLQNFNTFLYDAQVEGQSEIATNAFNGSTIDAGPSGLLSGGLGSFMGLSNLNTSTNGHIETTQGISFEGMGFGSNTTEMKKLNTLKMEYDAAINNMYKAEKQINYVKEDVDNYLEAKEVNKIILDELFALKQNPRLQPSQIKKLSKEYLQKVFNNEKGEEITLSKVIKKADGIGEVKALMNKLTEEEFNFKHNRKKLINISSALSTITIEDQELTQWKKSSIAALDQASQTEKLIDENKNQLQALYLVSQQRDLKTLVALRYEYEAIEHNDFSEVFRFQVDGDQMNINIKLLPKSKTENISSIELPTLTLPVSGGFKVNTSMGLSFGMFNKQPQSYFLKDSIISGQQKDKFTPLITSFFHFYPQTVGSVSLGGSFGVGIPLTGSNIDQSLSFMIGPSLIIGKGDRIVLSAGVMGGKTEHLDKGLQIGDRFNSEIADIPTTSSYKLGFYLGFSFNLLSK